MSKVSSATAPVWSARYAAGAGEAGCQHGLNYAEYSAHPDAPAVGVLTSEDVLEEILQEELTGDDDKYIDAIKRDNALHWC